VSLLWSDNSEYAFPKPQKAEKRVKLSPLKWEKMREQVYVEQNENCGGCGKHIRTLPEMHLHHKKLRKMGGGSRNDKRENLIGLCAECHGKEHNQ